MLSLFYWLLAIFLINLGIFIFVLTHERRSMWAGLTLTSTLMFLALLAVDFLIVVDTEHPEQHQLISGFLLLVAVGIALFIFVFVFLFLIIHINRFINYFQHLLKSILGSSLTLPVFQNY